MRLSIIIPMYNAGPFIGKCLISCLNQDIPHDDYEVIVLDDGSTDDGAAVVQSIIDGNGGKNIRLLRLTNGGAGAARNAGLKEASGDYVWFVDADDWIEENCLSNLLLQAAGCQILVFGSVDYCAVSTGLENKGIFRYPARSERSGPEHIKIMSERLKMCVPFHYFNRRFLLDNDLFFIPGLLHEDVDFIPKVFCSADSVSVSTATPYRRRIHPGTASRNTDTRRIDALLGIAGSTLCLMENETRVAGLKPQMSSIVSNILNQAMKLSASWDTGQDKIASFPDLPAPFIGAAELKYRVEGLLLRIFRHSPVKVYSFLSSFKKR